MSHRESGPGPSGEAVFEAASGIMGTEAERLEAMAGIDRHYMETLARMEEKDRTMGKIRDGAALLEATHEKEFDRGKQERLLREQRTERDALALQLEQLTPSPTFQTKADGYSPAHEATAWLEAIVAGWKKGGASYEEYTKTMLESAEKDEEEPPVDEQLLRAMEESGMKRVRQAVEVGIPDDEKARFAAALREFATLADHAGLIQEAKETLQGLESA